MTTLLLLALLKTKSVTPPCRDLSPSVRRFVREAYTEPVPLDLPSPRNPVESLSVKELRRKTRGSGTCLEYLYTNGAAGSGLSVKPGSMERRERAFAMLCKTDIERCMAAVERDLAQLDANGRGNRCVQLLRFTRSERCLNILAEGLKSGEPENAVLWLDTLLSYRYEGVRPYLAKLSASANLQVSLRARIGKLAFEKDFAAISKATYSTNISEHTVAIRVLALFEQDMELKKLAAMANHPNRDLILRALQPGGAASLR